MDVNDENLYCESELSDEMSDEAEMSDSSDFSDTVAKKKKTASQPVAKYSSASAKKGSTKKVEEIYQKKSQVEHILLRPDSYVGSIESFNQHQWVFDRSQNKLVNRSINYVPGLFKIFDEILVNAADNKQRDPSMDRIEVNIDTSSNEISVWNNGRGVPIVMHKEHNVYVPELIFGHLLTSSNYDDDEKKVTGGRNGYGAKLANIFSTHFRIETCDMEEKKTYVQDFYNNMSDRGEPMIKSCKKGKDYTKISFKPDLSRFGMESLDDDIVDLMAKRVYDLAGVTDKSVKVYLNGTRLPVNNFTDYVNLYITDDDAPRIHEKINDRWEVVMSLSDGQFEQVSFVNSICTTKGGQHVNYLADQITEKVAAAANKKNKGIQVKPFHVKNHLMLFVNCLIENPAFDSQTKDTLTSKKSAFGSTASISEKTLKQFLKSGIVDRVLSWAKFKQNNELKRKGGAKKAKIVGIPKLDDANNAGGPKAEDCTLILTEGDSAKALAVSGLSVVGRDNYGVFPLKGKLLNVREASHKQIMNNAEIQNIVKILGLQFGKQYDSAKGLRYGHLMIMADQDHDGSHIKGLVINFIHHFWPSLLQASGFLQEFITPIVKVSKGNRQLSFFTYPEYETWREATNGGKGWTIKYYKGLGTSTAKEAKEYFANLDRHVIDFAWEGEESENLIDLAFSKKRADDRKNWLTEFEKGTFVDYGVDAMKYSDFINRELILFSMADNVRSIPSLLDGLKPAQRKVLFCCFKRNLKKEIKVAQLAGYVSEHAAYHHGEMSLSATIVGMAQNFVGSNNLNLLVPAGQFGTRLMGGKDAASSRYIFTKLSPITRAIYHPDDDPILSYNEEDGRSIEPEWYLPIIPMVLVNGSDGIGTGWSSSIPNFNPKDIINNIRRKLKEEEFEPMTPWYRGFYGNIIPKDDSHTSFYVKGKAQLEDEQDEDCEDDETSKKSKNKNKPAGKVTISELPVKRWTQDYKQFLETLLPGAGKDESKTKTKASKTKKSEDEGNEQENCGWITEFREGHTETTVSFTLMMTREGMKQVKTDSALHRNLKLDGSMATTNMHLFDSNQQIKRYSSPEEVLQDFIKTRLPYYSKRKNYKLSQLQEEWEKLNNRVRFILAVVNGELKVNNVKKAELMKTLKAQGYKQFFPQQRAKSPDEEEESGNEEDEDETTTSLSKGYNYLLSMPIWSLTMEKVDSLRRELEGKEEELDRLKNMKPEDIWLEDLEALEESIADFEEDIKLDEEDERKARSAYHKANKKSKQGSSKKSTTGGGKAGGKAGAKARKQASIQALLETKKVDGIEVPTIKDKEEELSEEDSDEDSDFSEDDFVPVKPAPKKNTSRRTVTQKKEKQEHSQPTKQRTKATSQSSSKQTNPKSKDTSKEESESRMLSLAERLQMRMNVSPVGKHSSQAENPMSTVGIESITLSDEEEFEDFGEEKQKEISGKKGGSKAKKSQPSHNAKSSGKRLTSDERASAKTKATKNAKKQSSSSGEKSDENSLFSPVKASPAPKRGKKGPADQVVEINEDDDDEEDVVVTRPTRDGRRRATNKTTPNFAGMDADEEDECGDDDSDEWDSPEVSDNDDDDDDFEFDD